MQFLQSLEGQVSGFQNLITFEFVYWIRFSKILGHYIPYFWYLMSHRLNVIMSRFDVFSLKMNSFIRQIVMKFFYFQSFRHYFRYFFNISVASIWRSRWCIVTELSSSKRSLKVFVYYSLKALLCILLIQSFNCLL